MSIYEDSDLRKIAEMLSDISGDGQIVTTGEQSNVGGQIRSKSCVSGTGQEYRQSEGCEAAQEIDSQAP